jgi:exodeoxyribonuclease V alpha subunit
LKNDYTRGLFNGLLGVVQSADPEQGLEVQFEGFSEVHEIAPEQLVDLALAYAITCHRAQGSQAPAIIVPIYESKVLDPSWLYTAITRAERQVVLVGDLAVLREAVTMPWTAKRREIGLRWRT